MRISYNRSLHLSLYVGIRAKIVSEIRTALLCGVSYSRETEGGFLFDPRYLDTLSKAIVRCPL
jgi:hypothetical protein